MLAHQDTTRNYKTSVPMGVEKTSLEKERVEIILKKIDVEVRSQRFSDVIPPPFRARVRENMMFLGRATSQVKVWDPISEIQPGVYLGGIPSPKSDGAYSYNTNTEHAPHTYIIHYKIKLVVSILDVPIEWSMPDDVEHINLCGLDSCTLKLGNFFDSVSKRIYVYLKNGHNVLIHCHAGMSRSATILAAYYLKYGLPKLDGSNNKIRNIIDSMSPELISCVKKPSVEEVLQYISSKRRYIFPNYGFIYQLIEYEDSIKNEPY